MIAPSVLLAAVSLCQHAPVVPAPATGAGARLPGLVAADASPKLLVEGLRFAEGPAADRRGNVVFCDLAAGEIHRLVAAEDGWKRVCVANGTQGISGLAWSADGRLVGCQMRGGSVVALSTAGDGALVASPFAMAGDAARPGLNDLAFDGAGRLWVTNMGDRRHPEWTGLWCIAPGGAVTHSTTGATRPNGVRWSPHGGGPGVLWVTDYARPRAFRVPAGDGAGPSGTEVSLAFAASDSGRGGADGLAVDARGNAWIALPGHDRIAVVGPDGTAIGTIDVPDGPSNCCFGGQDGRTLFITTRGSVRALPTLVEGAWPPRGAPADAAPPAAPKAP